MSQLARYVGIQIRNLRTEAGLTQSRLAEFVGVSDEHISRLERGEKTPSLGMIGRIAEALQVPPSRLFQFELPSSPPSEDERLKRLGFILADCDEKTWMLAEGLLRALVSGLEDHRDG